MRSIRLSDDLDRQVRQAAALEGSSVSEFLRQAASERAERTLAADPAERLSYAIGVVRSDLHQARDTGAAFADLVEGKHRGRRR
jgi:Ribbon-helix-helix protein, copG family